MSYILEVASSPKYGLMMFKTYRESRYWLEDNTKELINLQAVINKARHEIIFPNGNRLLLGWGEGEDTLKYLGCRFDFIYGTSEPRLLSCLKL